MTWSTTKTELAIALRAAGFIPYHRQPERSGSRYYFYDSERLQEVRGIWSDYFGKDWKKAKNEIINMRP